MSNQVTQTKPQDKQETKPEVKPETTVTLPSAPAAPDVTAAEPLKGLPAGGIVINEGAHEPIVVCVNEYPVGSGKKFLHIRKYYVNGTTSEFAPGKGIGMTTTDKAMLGRLQAALTTLISQLS